MTLTQSCDHVQLGHKDSSVKYVPPCLQSGVRPQHPPQVLQTPAGTGHLLPGDGLDTERRTQSRLAEGAGLLVLLAEKGGEPQPGSAALMSPDC